MTDRRADGQTGRRAIRVGAAALFLAVVAAGLVMAQRGWRGVNGEEALYAPPNPRYDGRFTYARIRFTQTCCVYNGQYRDVKWGHDYPRSDFHFPKLLEELTTMRVRTDSTAIVTFDDPALFRYPWAYMSEPGYWMPSDREVEGLRNYLLKGGFLVIDDFVGNHWYNFEEQMRRVFPTLGPIPLDQGRTRSSIRSTGSSHWSSRIPTIRGSSASSTGFSKTTIQQAHDGDRELQLRRRASTGSGPTRDCCRSTLTNTAYKLGINYVDLHALPLTERILVTAVPTGTALESRDDLALAERLHGARGPDPHRAPQGHRRARTHVIEQALIALFAGGNCLVVGVPGLAKTLLIHSLAQALDLKFSRIQFTPDLMPSDVTGTDMIQDDPETGTPPAGVHAPGPIFANVVLADEINRTPPKTQAALLEAMQEHRVTVQGRTYQLEPPFFVFATQNPIELEGTYPLPEAQLDRFMFEIVIDVHSPRRRRCEIVRATTTRAAGADHAGGHARRHPRLPASWCAGCRWPMRWSVRGAAGRA